MVLKRALLSLWLLTILFTCSAQVIINKQNEIKTGEINFNPEIIKRKKVKTIRVNIVDKPDGAIIINKGNQSYYEFNSSGNLIRHYHTVFKKKVIGNNKPQYVNDTISTILNYGNENRLITKKVITDNMVETYVMKYNDSNQVIRETKTKYLYIVERDSAIKEIPSTLYSYKYEYIKASPTQTQIKIFNEYNLLYKKLILNYDSLHQLKSSYLEYSSGMLFESYIYVYDKNKHLVKISYFTNTKGGLKETITYEYLSNGELLAEKLYTNDELIYEVSYLYDSITGLVKSEVSRDYKKQLIIIAKYEYSFY